MSENVAILNFIGGRSFKNSAWYLEEKVNIKKILSVVLISSFSVLTFAQESENDDIFKNQSVQKNDFYEITV